MVWLKEAIENGDPVYNSVADEEEGYVLDSIIQQYDGLFQVGKI